MIRAESPLGSKTALLGSDFTVGCSRLRTGQGASGCSSETAHFIRSNLGKKCWKVDLKGAVLGQRLLFYERDTVSGTIINAVRLRRHYHDCSHAGGLAAFRDTQLKSIWFSFQTPLIYTMSVDPSGGYRSNDALPRTPPIKVKIALQLVRDAHDGKNEISPGVVKSLGVGQVLPEQYLPETVRTQ